MNLLGNQCLLRFLNFDLRVMNTLPESDSSHLQIGGSKMNFLLGWPIFRGELLVLRGVDDGLPNKLPSVNWGKSIITPPRSTVVAFIWEYWKYKIAGGLRHTSWRSHICQQHSPGDKLTNLLLLRGGIGDLSPILLPNFPLFFLHSWDLLHLLPRIAGWCNFKSIMTQWRYRRPDYHFQCQQWDSQYFPLWGWQAFCCRMPSSHL